MKKIYEVMEKNPVYVEVPGDRMKVLYVMRKYNLTSLPVVNARTRELEGVVSRRDLLNKMNEIQLSSLMDRGAPFAYADSPITEAAYIMIENDSFILPVVDRVRKFVGVITPGSMLQAVVDLDSYAPIENYAAHTTVPLYEQMPLPPAAAIMDISHAHACPVIDERAHLTGVLTERDVFRYAIMDVNTVVQDIPEGDDEDVYPWDAEQDSTRLSYDVYDVDFPDIPIYQIMANEPMVVHRNAGTSETAGRMMRYNFGQFPVLDNADRLVGMIYDLDLMRALVD